MADCDRPIISAGLREG